MKRRQIFLSAFAAALTPVVAAAKVPAIPNDAFNVRAFAAQAAGFEATVRAETARLSGLTAAIAESGRLASEMSAAAMAAINRGVPAA